MLEGYDHICRAAQMAKACGIDVIRSHIWRDPTLPSEITKLALNNFQSNFKVTPFLIPLAHDAKELGERIHAFWSVWIIDASGSATHGLARAFDDSKVETPLPLAIELYHSGGATVDNLGTLAQFWATEGVTDKFDPPFTHRIKATSVLEAACTHSRIYGSPAMGDVWVEVPLGPIEPIGNPEFEAKFEHIARTCLNLRDRLPNVSIGSITQADIGTDWYKANVDPVMIHSWGLTLCAIMTLYDIKAKYDANASHIALEAAFQMVGVVRRIVDLDFLQLDIMLGVCDLLQTHSFLTYVYCDTDGLGNYYSHSSPPRPQPA